MQALVEFKCWSVSIKPSIILILSLAPYLTQNGPVFGTLFDAEAHIKNQMVKKLSPQKPAVFWITPRERHWQKDMLELNTLNVLLYAHSIQIPLTFTVVEWKKTHTKCTV